MISALREEWLIFAFNPSSREVKSRVAPSREEARRVLAAELTGRVECCPSLADFGRAPGWRVAPVPPEVKTLACVLLLGFEHEWALGPLLASPLVEALLRACVLFLEAAPWRRFTSHQPLQARFTGALSGTRTFAVGGSGLLGPSLIILPDRAAFERSQRPQGELEEVLLVAFEGGPSALTLATEALFGFGFHPQLLSLKGGSAATLSEGDLKLLLTGLAATAALGSGMDVGRGAAAGVEVTVRAD